MTNEKDDLFFSLLTLFKKLGLLDDFILVGAWCMPYYRAHFGEGYPEQATRPTELDFLITNPKKPRPQLDVPAALEELGFQTQHAIGGTKYINGDLELAFLAANKGKAEEEAFQVRPLQLGAMTMRYLDFLQEHAIEVTHGGFKLSVPEPAAFVLQKFLINPRRSKSMQAKDLETISGLTAYLLTQEKETARMRELFDTLPGSLKKTVLGAADKHAPDLYEVLAKA
jgi:hypothetical protein